MNPIIAKIMLLVTVILMDVLGGAEVDLFIPSFPELQDKFDLTPFWVEALLSFNFAGFCLSLFFVGSLADRYGRKPIILLGLVIFVIGTLSCLWAPSYIFLLAGRFLQGLGIAAPTTLCFIIISDLYPIKQQQFYMAMLNGVANTSIAAAPVIGSYITLYFHWQGNFMALLILGLVVFGLTIFFIPSNKPPEVKEALSLSGYAPIFTSKPMLQMTLFFIFCSSIYWVFIGMSPLLYIEDLGVSLTHFGYYQGAMALVFALGSVLSGLIASKFDQKKLLKISTIACMISLAIIASVVAVDCMNPLIITLAMIPFSIAFVMPITILFPIFLNLMPESKGRVSAVFQGGRLIVSGIGLQLAGYFYAGSFRNIGIVIICYFVISLIALCYVIKNREIVSG